MRYMIFLHYINASYLEGYIAYLILIIISSRDVRV